MRRSAEPFATLGTGDRGLGLPDCLGHPMVIAAAQNINGLLRQYLPKGTDLSKHAAADLRRIQNSLKRRPRTPLGYMTPLEKFLAVIARTG